MAVVELTPQEKAVEMFNQGSTPKQVSDSLGIPEGTAKTWKTRHYKPLESVNELETALQELKLKSEKDEAEFQILKRKNEATETELQKLKISFNANESAFQKLELSFSANETAFQLLKRENGETETAFQKLKRTETDLQNEAKLLRGQIDNLQAQLKSHTTTGSRELGNQERLLNAQIALLTKQLDKANDALASIDKTWSNRLESKENAFQKALENEKKLRVEAMEDYNRQLEAVKLEAEKQWATEEALLNVELEKLTAYAAKWASVESKNKKELFLRRLNFAYAIVACLVIVQSVEASLFTQLAYKDAGFEGIWVKIVSGLLCIGFQGIALFLTVNRQKTFRGIRLGKDEYGNIIYKKDANGEVETEPCYDMTTMQVLCSFDFLINCFVFFGKATFVGTTTGEILTQNAALIARLGCFSLIAPLGIYFTSEILLNIIDKREKLIS